MVGMIDAGFIVQAAAKLLKKNAPDVRIEAEEIVSWLRISAARRDSSFLRAYWYDGAYPRGEAKGELQRQRFEELQRCPGLQLRLGHLESRPFDRKHAARVAAEELEIDYDALIQKLNREKIYHQKGVDTLIVLDMVRLIQQGSCSTLVLVAGDRDLAEAIRTVQQLGGTVILAYPKGAPVADELRDLADERVAWSEALVRRLTSREEDRFTELLDLNTPDGGE